MNGSGIIKFAEGLPEKSDPRKALSPWQVLIVDDEPQIHVITRQVLTDLSYEGRFVEFLSAYSGREAREIIVKKPDIAVVLLDVVMESDDAGLEVANFIRNNVHNRYVRIILRTGQPGLAPERKVIVDYDINDYKDKTDITATKLYTTIISTLRDYSLLKRLDRCLSGMDMVIKSLSDLLRVRSFQQFAEGLLAQVLALLNIDESGLYVDVTGFTSEETKGSFTVIAGTGDFADPSLREGHRKIPDRVQQLLEKSVEEKRHLYLPPDFVGYIPSERTENVRLLYLRNISSLEDDHRHLIETFLSNINVSLDAVIELEEHRRTTGSTS
jgi:CheY-like chemotaxis protein